MGKVTTHLQETESAPEKPLRFRMDEDKYQHHHLCSAESSYLGAETRPGPSDQDQQEPAELRHLFIMHCGYLFILGLCAELAACRVLPRDTGNTDADMRSIIDDLLEALQKYSSVLRKMNGFRSLPVLPCTETAAHLEQSDSAICSLSRYQVCVEQLGSFCPYGDAQHQAITLNQDLLQHLNGSNIRQISAACPTSTSSTTSSTAFDSMCKCIQCVQCWSQQVAALHG